MQFVYTCRLGLSVLDVVGVTETIKAAPHAKLLNIPEAAETLGPFQWPLARESQRKSRWPSTLLNLCGQNLAAIAGAPSPFEQNCKAAKLSSASIQALHQSIEELRRSASMPALHLCAGGKQALATARTLQFWPNISADAYPVISSRPLLTNTNGLPDCSGSDTHSAEKHASASFVSASSCNVATSGEDFRLRFQRLDGQSLKVE